MNIQDLTDNLIEHIIEDGSIDISILNKILIDHPSPKLKATVALIHSLFCNSVHNEQCSYYDEIDLVDSEIQKKWTKLTLDLADLLQIDNLEDLNLALKFVITMAEKVKSKEKLHPASAKLYQFWLTRSQTAEFQPSSLSFPDGPAMTEEPTEA